MVTLKETINSVSTEHQFKTVKDACEFINLQVEHSKSLIGKPNVSDEGFEVTSVSKNNIHTFKFDDKIQHAISWTVYFKNGNEIKCDVVITEEKRK